MQGENCKHSAELMVATARPCLASLEGEFNEEGMPKRKDLLRGGETRRVDM